MEVLFTKCPRLELRLELSLSLLTPGTLLAVLDWEKVEGGACIEEVSGVTVSLKTAVAPPPHLCTGW